MKSKSIFASSQFALGEFADLVTIEERQTPGGTDYVALAEAVAARVVPVGAYERWQSAQLQSAVTYRVTIPGAPTTLDETMRIVWLTSPTGAPVTLNIQTRPTWAFDQATCDCVEAHR